MPRLNHNNYVARHQFLKKSWRDYPVIFSSLPPHQQWEIHAYYQPSKNLTDSQLREHRRTISKQNPSLPHRAGRAFAVIDGFYQQAVQNLERRRAGNAIGKSQKRAPVRVYAIVHPEPDLKRLAKIFLAAAEAMSDKERSGK